MNKIFIATFPMLQGTGFWGYAFRSGIWLGERFGSSAEEVAAKLGSFVKEGEEIVYVNSENFDKHEDFKKVRMLWCNAQANSTI